ncbi:peptidylprolyl isomerase [bacterium]|nr:peptidylprolyl isomerase [bacterium]
MKKFLLSSLLLLIMAGCSNVKKSPALKEGDPAFKTGKIIAEKISFFDPADNRILVKSSKFVINSGDVCRAVHSAMGEDIDRLREISIGETRKVLNDFTQSLTERELFDLAANEEKIIVEQTYLDSILNIYYQTAGSKDRYLQQLVKQEKDSTEFFIEIEELLKRQKYLQQLAINIPVTTEDEMKSVYEEMLSDVQADVRHILLMTKGKSKSEKSTIHKKMRGLLRRAKNGEDFSKLADQYSEDPGSNSNGGLYRNIKKGAMVKPFEDAAFSVPVGRISDIVETEFGLHILKIIDRTARLQPFEDIRIQIGQQILMNKQQELYQQKVMELKIANKVTITAF